MIETALLGDDAACRRQGEELATTARKIEAAVDALTRAGHQTQEWKGMAGDSFREEAESAREAAVDLGSRVRRASHALQTFATGLDELESRMDAARDHARSAGLTVSGTLVHEPPPRVTTATPGVLGQLAPAEGAAFEQVRYVVTEIRRRERELHGTLHSELAMVRHDGVLLESMRFLGLTVTDDATQSTGALWSGAFLATGAGGLADWFGNVRRAQRINAYADDNPWARLARGLRGIDELQAKRGMAESRAHWKAAGKVAGRAGAGFGGALGAWEQWQADADDPTRGDEQRAARAGLRGGTIALGGWGGAVGGAAVGSMICPGVGTVVGGVIGGAIGSGFADKAADAVLNEGKHVFDGVGDALTFWD